jgi:choline dehydrogenase-like flavoprotein
MYLNLKAKKEHTYDAIVIGTGITGGWAAKELTEKGLKTLVLERGRNVEHVKDYPTAMKAPWQFEHRGRLTNKRKEEQSVQSRSIFCNEETSHFFINDKENPYTEAKRFDWIRGYQVGGRSLLWTRQCYRWSEMDFEANAKDGVEIDWPIRYQDIAPWYDYVEAFVGISGQAENLPQLPDGIFLPPMEMTCLEKHVKQKMEARFPERKMIMGRTANLTKPHNGRGNCMYRGRCDRGCPYGAYFSSNAATLPAAAKTGNMVLRPHSIVNSIIYDEKTGKAIGVRVIDAKTKEWIEFYARIIFVNASTLNSTFILLNSTSSRFPNGLGNSSGVLGHHLMDHHGQIGFGNYEGFEDRYYYGRRPNGVYVPRFRNIKDKHPDFIRGYGMQGHSMRSNWERGNYSPGFGAQFKEDLTKPGPWQMLLVAFGECLPYYENKVSLNHNVVDKWGQPTLTIDCEFKENEYAMRKDIAATTTEILETAGLKNVFAYAGEAYLGGAIHEMGTARMGTDPKTSILNKYNQVHEVPNVFVTDGAGMVSSACQNPSLTYMALTARACDYAVKELKKMNL